MTVRVKAATTLCLENPAGSTTAGTAVRVAGCVQASTAQEWRLLGLAPLNGQLASVASDRCLDLSSSIVVIAACDVQRPTQHWQLETTNGLTRLYNVGADRCLDFATAMKGQAGVVKACTGGTSQQFITQQDNQGTGSGTDNSLRYPQADEFAQAATAVADAQAAAKVQLGIARAQAAVAAQAAVDTDYAQLQAYTTADGNGTPRGRGLLAAQQEAQVTAASSAALTAIVAAATTAYQATTASAQDTAALRARAETQAAASTAAFRLAAAREADAQAKAAAAGAAEQARVAEAANTRAQAALGDAQQAEAAASKAAAIAHAKRLAAEAEAAKAAANRRQAAAYQATAAADRAAAQQQAQTADAALARARTAGDTAAQKRRDAEQADADATAARRRAWDAARNRDALAARAHAADAYAAAHAAATDAADARAAADQADAAAADAATAADKAQADADAANTAARAADAAATRAEAAARRAQSDADAAAAAKADADAAVRADEVAVATAIAAATKAATAADTALQDAVAADADAATAWRNADAAATEATRARTGAATTAGYAYTTARAATAAADAAATVTAPANDAIQLGSPYIETDSSAGLAVLTAQASKTIAEQQQAAAQAKADQAAKAAQAAQALADIASGDAKAAATAAADATTQAAAAHVSAQHAVASAAHAQKAAALAQASLARAKAYDAQATADASAARAAATAAAADAAVARADATQAETDAAAAQAAATQAKAAAARAHDIAVQADRDAAAAEAAAKDAEQQAASAQQAVVAAEQQHRDQADTAALTSDGPAGEVGVVVEPHIHTEIVGKPDCIIFDGTHCRADVQLHVTGELIYLTRTCPDPATTDCPGLYVTDYLATVPVDQIITRTVVLNYWQVIGDFWKSFAIAMGSDFIGCAHGELTDCAWVASYFVLPPALRLSARAVLALRVAIDAGVGIGRALEVLRAGEISAEALAKLTEEVNSLTRLVDCPGNSFVAGTRVLLADGTTEPIEAVAVGDHVLAGDPATGRTRSEPVTALIRHGGPHTLVDVGLAGGGALRATDHHPFWVVDAARFVDAADLRTGDVLLGPDGHHVTVASLRVEHVDLTAYNLTVADLHTYYVTSGGTPVLVHNAAPACLIEALSATGRARYDLLADTLAKARALPPETLRSLLTEAQVDAAQGEKSFLRRMFLGSALEKWVANQPAVLADTNIAHLGTSRPGQAVADFVISDGTTAVNIDITTVKGAGAHMGRAYIQGRAQILDYAEFTDAELKAIFQ